MKIKNLIILLILLLFALPNYAGEQDTMLRYIMSKPDNSEKLFELINYSNRNAISKPLFSLNAASKALELSFRLRDKRGEAYAYNSLGTLNYNSQNYTKAIEYFEKAVPLFVSIADKKGEAYALKHLGFAHEKQKNFSKAIEYYDRYEQKNSAESPKEVAKVKVSKVRSYEKTNQPEQSKREVAEIESNTSKLSPADKIEIYKELGEIFYYSSDTLSEKFLNKAIALDQKNEGAKNTFSYNALSDLYRKQNKEEKADEIENLKIAKIKGNQNEDSIQLNIKEKIIRGEEWKELSLSYERKGDFKKALEAFKNYMQLYDTLKQQQIADSVEKNNLISNLINNEDRIKALEQSREAQAKVISFQRSISMMLGAGLLIVFAGLYFLWRISKQKEISNLKLRFQSLSNRMNPHFIYNSLNSVNLFIAKNQEKEANKFLADFSKLMRMVMDNSSREMITLKEELNVIEKYLLLEHNRFGKRFEYKIDISDDLELENLLVPPMVIQPYVENAIWHGLRYRDDNNGLVSIQIKQEGEFVVCSITDNGIGRANSQQLKTKNQLEHKSAGMKNSFERIEILNKIYRKKLKIKISNAFQDDKNPGTLIQLFIPLEKQ